MMTVNRLKNYLSGFDGDTPVRVIAISKTDKWVYKHKTNTVCITDAAGPVIFAEVGGIDETVERNK